jgi:toxin-antitoxin system PIN domain toxin
MLFAVNENAMQHQQAKSWLEMALSGTELIAFDWVAMLGFVRLSTRHGVFVKPLEPARAFYFLKVWLDSENTRILLPTENHFETLRRLVERSGTAANLTTDAHLAALAIEHGAELVSFDRDFVRFDGLRTVILKA